MGDQQDVTLGEIWRKLCDVHDQTTITNGRVNKHDSAIAVLNWAVMLVGLAALAALGAVFNKVFG